MVGDVVCGQGFGSSTINHQSMPLSESRITKWTYCYWVGALVDRLHWYYEMSNWQLASACLIDDDAVNTATDDPIRLDYISPLKLNI